MVKVKERFSGVARWNFTKLEVKVVKLILDTEMKNVDAFFSALVLGIHLVLQFGTDGRSGLLRKSCEE